jgi:restriction system protein
MIPTYQELMRPVLAAAQSGPRRISDVVEEISVHLNLTDDERQQMLPSGKQTTIANRVHWARSYLKQAGLVQNTKRSWYELTECGRNVLSDQSITLNTKFLEQFSKFQEFRSRGQQRSDATDEQEVGPPAATTPDEDIQSAHRKLEDALAASLLESARQVAPAFFERLILDLFIAMGYGGSTVGAGQTLGKSGDNGVDGVIDQDPLGVDQIYLQAKRYAAGNNVSAGELRDFFGALSIKKANKGIFVTTSNFTDSARQTAVSLGSRIVLIDGPQLARLMVRYNVGCEPKETLILKELDDSYFDEDTGI